MNVLIVDDNPAVLKALAPLLADDGYRVREARTLATAVAALREAPPQIVLLDVYFPREHEQGRDELSASRFLDEIDRLGQSRPRVILMSGENLAAKRFDDFVEWLESDRIADIVPKGGAYDFFAAVVRHRVEALAGAPSIDGVEAAVDNSQWLRKYGIITSDPEMLRVAETIRELLALTDNSYPILILGERGVGKTHLVSAIRGEMARLRNGRDKSKTGDVPLISINCATLQPTVAESQLFGHPKGAFTGAFSEKRGHFDAVEDGLLFLDEVHALGLDIQIKLNQVLENRFYFPFNEAATTMTKREFFGRVVAGTNADIEQLLEGGKMHADFFDRLEGGVIRIPSLAQRPGDIELLANHFLEMYAQSENPTALAEDAFSALQNYSWPGNVRQLSHIIRAVIGSRRRSAVVTLGELQALGLTYHAVPIKWALPIGRERHRDVLLARTGVSPNWADFKSGDELLETLANRLTIEAFPVLKQLVDELAARENNAPDQVHFLKIWYYLVLREGVMSSTRSLIEVSGLGHDYVGRITKYLAGVPHPKSGPGFVPAVISMVREKGKLSFQCKNELLKKG